MRAAWRGTISFGLVTVRVRLYPAVQRKRVRFRELDRQTGQRVRHQRVVPGSGWKAPDEDAAGRAVPPPHVAEEIHPEPDRAARLPPEDPSERGHQGLLAPHSERALATEVAREDLIHGYEYSPGQFVEVADEELADLAPERTKTIDVEQFVARTELDVAFFDSSYYVVPDGSARPFAVLLRAMQQTNRAAICWIVLRSRRHLAVLQPRGELMLLTTLLFSDEVVATKDLEQILPSDLQEREVEMAELLLATLGGPWEPERYRDEYRDRVVALVEGRAAAEQFGEAAEQKIPVPAGVEELLAALKASVDEARTRRGGEGESRRGQHRRGA